jgi:hypothetical protein
LIDRDRPICLTQFHASPICLWQRALTSTTPVILDDQAITDRLSAYRI